MAIEDGVVLARCITESDSIKAAFERYETARLERTAFVQLESRAKGLRLEDNETEKYNKKKHRSEESVGLFKYDAATTPYERDHIVLSRFERTRQFYFRSRKIRSRRPARPNQ